MKVRVKVGEPLELAKLSDFPELPAKSPNPVVLVVQLDEERLALNVDGVPVYGFVESVTVPKS